MEKEKTKHPHRVVSASKATAMQEEAINFLRAKKFSSELINHNVKLFHTLTYMLNNDASSSLKSEPLHLLYLSLYHNLWSAKQLPPRLQGSIGSLLETFIELKKHDMSGNQHKWHYYSELINTRLPLIMFRMVDISMLPLQSDILIHLFGFDKRRVDEQMKNIATSMHLFYAPIASILNLHKITATLRNSSASVLYPKLYTAVVEELMRRKDYLESTEKSFAKELNDIIMEALVTEGINIVNIGGGEKYYKSRMKQPGSIVLKLVARDMGIERIMELHDLIAFTVVTQTEKEAYYFSDLMRMHFGAQLVNVEDFIEKPRQNGYKALHVDLHYNNVNVEVQIKSYEMYERCERGDLPHALYKPAKLDPQQLYQIQQYSHLISDATTDQIEIITRGQGMRRLSVTALMGGKNVKVELPEGSCIFDLVCNVSDPSVYNLVSSPTTGLNYSLLDPVSNGSVYKVDVFPREKGPSYAVLRSLANRCMTPEARIMVSSLQKKIKEERRRR